MKLRSRQLPDGGVSRLRTSPAVRRSCDCRRSVPRESAPFSISLRPRILGISLASPFGSSPTQIGVNFGVGVKSRHGYWAVQVPLA